MTSAVKGNIATLDLPCTAEGFIDVWPLVLFYSLLYVVGLRFSTTKCEAMLHQKMVENSLWIVSELWQKVID